MKNQQRTINVITILWGDKYQAQDINLLRSMLRRNTRHKIDFHLFSDEELPDLDAEIIRHPEPKMDVGPQFDRFVYRKEAALCADDLGGLEGQRVFFFDIDVLITGNLDELFEYPEGENFYIINDWNTKGVHVGQATCYSFVVGTLGDVRTGFERDPQAIVDQFWTASQEYLSSMVIKKYGKLNFWPEKWFRSFRFHCMPAGPLRHFLTPRKPGPETKLVAFHGYPDLHDAVAGRWSKPDSPKVARGWKRIYKACRPTPWIKDYWY